MSVPDSRRELVRWVAGLGAVTAEALAVRERATLASARGRLAAAAHAGLLACHRPLARRPTLYVATRLGVRACAPGLRPARVVAHNAEHAVACAGVAARLERRFPRLALLGEASLRAGACLEANAQLGAAAGAPRSHRPDMVLVSGSVAIVAVEVELTAKAPARLLAICRAWARTSALAGVVYFAAPGAFAAVRRAVEATGAACRVLVLPLASADGSPRTVPVAA